VERKLVTALALKSPHSFHPLTANFQIQPLTPLPTWSWKESFHMASDAQLNANKMNAQLSPGPVTDAGKAICAQNALKHGLTSRMALLPTDDKEAYENLVAIILEKYRPETDPEHLLIQQIADIEWRLLRVPLLESGIFLKGRKQAEKLYLEMDPQERRLLIDAETQCNESKALSNLTLQQSRWQRQLERKTAEFKELRHEREIVQTARRDMAMRSILGKDTVPDSSVGSEFSVRYLTSRVAFKHYAPTADIVMFDRTWRDKSSRTPD
jgi:hypothetical protein